MKEKEAVKKLKAITLHINKIRKKCKTNGLWLSAGFDALKDPVDNVQQGPLVTKLYTLVDDAKEYLKGK